MGKVSFILKNSLWFLCLGIAMRIIPFILIPVYTKYLSPEDYGIVAICLTMTGIFSVLNTLGLVEFGSRILIRFHEKKNILSLLLGNIYGLTIIIALSFSIFLSFFSGPLKIIFFAGEQLPSDIIVIIPVWISFSLCVSGFLQAYQTIYHRGKDYFFINTGKVFLIHSLKIIILVYLKLGVVGFLAAELISEVLIAIISLSWLIGLLKPKFNPRKTRVVKMAFLYGIPFIPASIAGWIQQYIDRIMMLRIIDMKEVGLYSFGLGFSSILFFFWQPFRMGVTPAFVKRLDNQKKYPNAFREFSEFATGAVILCCIAGLFLSLFAKDIIFVIANTRFHQAHIVVPLLIVALIFQNIREIFDVPITLKYKTWFYLISTITGAGINVMLNMVLIPTYGMLGAALATLITFVLTLGITIIYAQTLMKIPYDYSAMLNIIFISGLLYSITKIISLQLIWMLVFKVVLVGAFLMFTVYYSRKSCPVLYAKVIDALPRRFWF